MIDIKKCLSIAWGIILTVSVHAQGLASTGLEKPIRAEDAKVAGGFLRTQVLRDSLMINPETGQTEKMPVVVDFFDIPVDELGCEPEEAIKRAKAAHINPYKADVFVGTKDFVEAEARRA